ncbi:MAG: polysaccharide deacetylase family protein [Clostridia bacterium]|nr:polysaccharide deacetylase family protein [Clostridia bacterium]
MKKFLYTFLIFFVLSLFAVQSVFAAAPPQKDGVIFSGSISCGKKIALTFDDGPHPYKTLKILDLLDKYGVKATFFIIGSNAEYHPEIVAEEAARGHELANHSYSHAKLSVMTEEEIRGEIELSDKIIEKASGITPKLFRPPEGAYSENVVKVASELGKSTIIWTVDTLDWAKTPRDTIVENVKTSVTSGSIILFHDFTNKDTHTFEALEILIPYLQEQGYEFVTVSELLAENN